jgi:hypothetical protein
MSVKLTDVGRKRTPIGKWVNKTQVSTRWCSFIFCFEVVEVIRNWVKSSENVGERKAAKGEPYMGLVKEQGVRICVNLLTKYWRTVYGLGKGTGSQDLCELAYEILAYRDLQGVAGETGYQDGYGLGTAIGPRDWYELGTAIGPQDWFELGTPIGPEDWCERGTPIGPQDWCELGTPIEPQDWYELGTPIGPQDWCERGTPIGPQDWYELGTPIGYLDWYEL